MTRPGVGIVHLGIGAFFRAFGLPYLEDAMAQAGGDWGVLGVSLRSPDVRDRLMAQDWIYHAVELSAEGRRARRIEALRGVLFAGDQRDAVLDAMCDPGVSIVSLTVTEKGYCHAPATGRLDRGHAGIVADLASPRAPGDRAGVSGRGLGAAAGRGAAAVYLSELRQPAGEWRAAAVRGAGPGAAARPGPCRLDRGRGAVSVDHGRPDRARDDGGRSARGRGSDRRAGCGGGGARAVRAMGDRGRFRRWPASGAGPGGRADGG